MLRTQPADCYAEDAEDADDPLGAIKGILLMVMLSLPFWATIVMVASFVMR